ncbi:MAG: alpha/beta fold hydrolase [Candidatus Limnocylindrales bacterium]
MVAQRSGEGPPLLLLHGLAGSARWWERNIPALSRSFQVSALDLPGFGGSHADARLVLDDIAAQLVALLDDLGIERASVVGHSLGGLVAGGLAADYPERVDRLVLVDAGFLSLDPSRLHRITGPLRTLRWTAPSLMRVIVTDTLRSGPVRMAGATMELLQADWRGRLPRIQAPTLVVWGEHDTICPRAIGEAIVAAVPAARLHIIKGAAHNPMWERSEDFDRVVLQFLLAAA